MKKMVMIVFALLFFVTSVHAESDAFAGMEQSEILNMINAGRNALVLQETADGLLRYDTGYGITIIFTQFNNRLFNDKYNQVEVVIINDTDADYKIYCESLYINGWKCESLISASINAHRRMNDDWYFILSDANLKSIAEISEMEFYLKIYPDGRTRDLLDIPPAVIVVKDGD